MRRRRLLTLLVILIALILLCLPVPLSLRVKAALRDVFAPFQNALLAVGDKGVGAFSALSNAKGAVEERERLMEENATLRYHLRRLKYVEAQNDLLREQLAFSQRKKSKLLLCRVANRGDATGWWHTVRLNRGADHGVKPDMPVMTTAGLAGRTVNVSATCCDVLLASDPKFKVSCRLSRAGTFGLLTGGGFRLGGEAKLEMLASIQPAIVDYIDKKRLIRPNDEVVTSGLGGVFPGGLVVGYVRETALDPSALYQRATVTPAADLGMLRYVFVILEWDAEDGV